MGNPSSLCKPPAAFSSGVFLSVSSFEGKDPQRSTHGLRRLQKNIIITLKLLQSLKKKFDGSFLTLRRKSQEQEVDELH